MSTHGFDFPISLSDDLAQIFILREQKNIGLPGYRHFIGNGKVKPDDLYVGLGFARDNEILFEKLLRRLVKLQKFKDGADSSSTFYGNPNIPAGYTYLFQLVAHDLTKNTSLPGVMDEPIQKNFNARRRGLLLDTLYGGGPQTDKSVYEAESSVGEFRSHLRVGKVDPKPRYDAVEDTIGCPYLQRDLPRSAQTELKEPTNKWMLDVLVADERNDDTPMISQLVVLFHLAHNAILEKLKAATGLKFTNGNVPSAINLFEATRYILTKVYWNILKRDALKRMLNADVYAEYEASNFKPLADKNIDEIPMEFSHACCRVGHAMIREAYQFNRFHSMQELRVALATNSNSMPQAFPLEQSWVAQWSQFFEIDGNKPLLSRRIGPGYNRILMDETLFRNLDFGKYTPQKGSFPGGLLLRDLIRGTMEGMLKLSVLRELVPNKLQQKSSLLSKNGDWEDRLLVWLEKDFDEFSPRELDSLVKDPPLLFWILFEAMEQEDGKRLGTLGSLIFGDVLLARIDQKYAPPKYSAEGQSLDDIVFESKMPQSMPDLIEFVSKSYDLDDRRPRFL